MTFYTIQVCKDMEAHDESGHSIDIVRTINTILKKCVILQGVQKKMRRSFCLIPLATNMLESWDLIHWKGGIHSFVWSKKTFLYHIWEPRNKQIKMGY